jgi:ferredoxin-like protein FixX
MSRRRKIKSRTILREGRGLRRKRSRDRATSRGRELGAACPTKLYKLVQKGDLTMKQFLSVVSVKKIR